MPKPFVRKKTLSAVAPLGSAPAKAAATERRQDADNDCGGSKAGKPCCARGGPRGSNAGARHGYGHQTDLIMAGFGASRRLLRSEGCKLLPCSLNLFAL